MRLVVFALALCFAGPADARTRSQAHWGGADFEISCETVRSFRVLIKSLSPESRADFIRQYKITRKQQRQARACLK